jgi:hypothetical protein
MKHELIAELRMRNARIIAAIIKKAHRVCPGSIALIGIGGSFCSGDIHERSDLDLCIVINDDDGWKIADCFILNEVGFDIYCTPWHRLEAMAEYTNPHVMKLLHLDIVYHADNASLTRYISLRKVVQDKLDAPFSIEEFRIDDLSLFADRSNVGMPERRIARPTRGWHSDISRSTRMEDWCLHTLHGHPFQVVL